VGREFAKMLWGIGEQRARPCNQGIKIGVPKVFRRISRNSSTNISGVPRNSDSYPPNTLEKGHNFAFISILKKELVAVRGLNRVPRFLTIIIFKKNHFQFSNHHQLTQNDK
jgi:hypothetical protein